MALWDGTAPLSIGRRDRSLASRTEEQSPSLQDGGLAHGSLGLTDGACLSGTDARGGTEPLGRRDGAWLSGMEGCSHSLCRREGL